MTVFVALMLCIALSLASCGGNNNSIKYELDGGTLSGAPTTYSPESIPDLDEIIPTKEGFTFGGWYTDANFKKEAKITAGTTGEVVLYAKWISSFTLSYEYNGGAGANFPTSYVPGDDFDPSDYVPTKENSIFFGWYFDGEFDERASFDEDTTGNKTLYARWLPAPAKTADIPDRAKAYLGEGTSFTVNVADYINKNGSTVNYKATSSDTTVATVAIDGDNVTVTLLKNSGTSTITVEVYVDETKYVTLDFDATARSYNKVACIGDSLTMKRDEDLTPYPEFLHDLLGTEFEVLNAGKSGVGVTPHGRYGEYTVYAEEQYQNSLDFAPEIIIIMLGTNDAKGWDADFNGGPGCAKDVFKAKYKELVGIYQQAFPGVEIYLVSSPKVRTDNDLSIPYAKIDGDIHTMQLEIAEELGLPIFDLHPLLDPTSSTYFVADGVHFTDAGASYVADLIYEFIKTH